MRDAIRFRLTWLKGDNQCLEISRGQDDRFNEVLREMDTPFRSAEHFTNSQIDQFLEKYEEYKNSNRK